MNPSVAQATDQDISVIRNADNWNAVDSVVRAMKGLKRWTPEAQKALDEATVRFGAEPGENLRFSARMRLAETIWHRWLMAHRPETRRRLSESQASKRVFMAGAMMALGSSARQADPTSLNSGRDET